MIEELYNPNNSYQEKTNTPNHTLKRLVDTKHLMEILDCGKNTAIKIGTLANAKVCIGRKLFWNVKLIQQYIDSIAQ